MKIKERNKTVNKTVLGNLAIAMVGMAIIGSILEQERKEIFPKRVLRFLRYWKYQLFELKEFSLWSFIDDFMYLIGVE